MPQRDVITLTIDRSLGAGLEITITSATGTDGDEDLTLSARSGFALEGESWSTRLDPEAARRLWRLLDDFEIRGARSEVFGLDGSTYSMEIRAAQAQVSLEWWEQPPAGWIGPLRLRDELLSLAGPQAAPFLKS